MTCGVCLKNFGPIFKEKSKGKSRYYLEELSKTWEKDKTVLRTFSTFPTMLSTSKKIALNLSFEKCF